MERSCFCGCESFRFKWSDPEEGNLYYNICKNCNHTLAEHLKIVRSKQAD